MNCCVPPQTLKAARAVDRTCGILTLSKAPMTLLMGSGVRELKYAYCCHQLETFMVKDKIQTKDASSQQHTQLLFVIDNR